MELKAIRPSGVEAALARAKQYRLLNEPFEAESICRDILAVASAHEEAKVVLVLALTDQFRHEFAQTFERAKEALAGLENAYEQIYYQGVVFERRGIAQLRRSGSRAGSGVHEWLSRAMDCYEKAAELAPDDNDEAVLRWNSCVRRLRRHPEIQPEEQDSFVALLE